MRLEHQVEHARFVQRPSTLGTPVALDVVRAPPLLACAQALAERVDEVSEVAGGGPDRRWHDERGFQAHHVVTQLHHVAPPQVADRPLHRDPIGSVVVEARDPAVDLARREDEAAPLRERHDFFHQLLAIDRHASSLLPTRSPPAPSARGPQRTADPPTWWGGEFQARYSPPGAAAARPGRPPHTVGRRFPSSILPTRSPPAPSARGPQRTAAL